MVESVRGNAGRKEGRKDTSKQGKHETTSAVKEGEGESEKKTRNKEGSAGKEGR